MYVKYYNPLCNTETIQYFSNIWEAKSCKEQNDGEFVNEKGEKIW